MSYAFSDQQNKLNSLSTQYDNANTASSAVLTEQRDMIDIVNTEHKRLLDKQAIIDEAQAEATKAAQKQALLNRLGITEDEAKLLLGGN